VYRLEVFHDFLVVDGRLGWWNIYHSEKKYSSSDDICAIPSL
jgi:hypothetical protein